MTHQFNGLLTDKDINHRLPKHTQVTLLSLWFMMDVEKLRHINSWLIKCEVLGEYMSLH